MKTHYVEPSPAPSRAICGHPSALMFSSTLRIVTCTNCLRLYERRAQVQATFDLETTEESPRAKPLASNRSVRWARVLLTLLWLRAFRCFHAVFPS